MAEFLHPDEQKFFDVALGLVQTAGRLVRDAFDTPTSVVMIKSSSTDLVTETDQAVEKMLIDGLSKAFPDHKFIGEESVSGGAKIEFTDAPTWIIDPIDGTTNFVHRIPMIAICVGLTIKKQLRAGIVFNPITRELYTAQTGRGAFKNGFPIHVSNNKTINTSVLCASMGIHNVKAMGGKWLEMAQSNIRKQIEAGVRGCVDSQIRGFQRAAIENSVIVTQLGSYRHEQMKESYVKTYQALMIERQAHGHRSFGSAAINMIMVSQGCVDAYVEYGLHAWDMAAPAVVLLEAGGVMFDPSGSDFNLMGRKILCAATKELAMEISSKLTHADFEPEA